MAAASFEDTAARNSDNIRKALKGAVFIAPYSAPLVTTLVATGGQIDLPSGFESAGFITTDGATEAGSIDISDLNAWGVAFPVRQDVTGAEASLQVTLMEDKKLTRELYDGVDLSATPVSGAGELKYEIDALPDIHYYRAIVLSMDGSGPTRRYWATAYHKVSVTDKDDLVNANGDDAFQRGVTLSATPDGTTGTIATKFAFGPGLLARATVEGYVLGS